MISNEYSARARLLALIAALALPLAACEKKDTKDSGNEDGPPDPQTYVDAALADMDEGRKLEDVHAKFQQGCDLHKSEEFQIPIHVKACYNTALTAAKLGDNRKAIAYYKIALKGDDSFKPAVQNLTYTLLQAGEAADALPYFEGYLKANPDDREMVNNYAGALGEAGKYDEGVKVIEDLLFEEPKNIYFLQGNYRMSQLASANALKFTPEDGDIHNNIGLTFLKEGKEGDAVAAFKEALKLDENNIQANMNLGLIALKAADWQQAAECFNKVLSQEPGNADARVGLAVAYRGIAEFDSAIEEYDKILKVDKCNSLALINKAVVQGLFLDDYKASLKTYDAHKKCYPETDIEDRVAVVAKAQAEQEEMMRQQAELERQAKEFKPKLMAKAERAQRVFAKYKDVEQDPSWAEQLDLQIEQVQFAIESEDITFMQEAGLYLDEFIVSYYEYALEKPADEWTDESNPIDVPADGAEAGSEGDAGAEGAPAEGDAGASEGDAGAVEGGAAPAEGDAAPAEGDAAPAEGDAAPAEGDAGADAAPAEGEGAE